MSDFVPFLDIQSRMSTSSSNRSGLRYSQEAVSRGHPILFPSHSVATLVPKLRRNSCSADSIKIKNLEKWTMPAISVSENSIFRFVRYSVCIGVKSRFLFFGDSRLICNYCCSTRLKSTSTRNCIGNFV